MIENAIKGQVMTKIIGAPKVIFNGPATIVFWVDGTKTVTVCGPKDTYDKQKGFLIAFFARYTGSTTAEVSEYLNSLGE